MRPLTAVPVLLCLIPLSSVRAEEFEIADRDVPALVQALRRAAQTPGADTLRLAWGGVYTLEATDSAGLGLPVLHGGIQIEGNGAEIRRYADAPMALLEVAEDASVVIRKLSLAEGSLGVLRNHGDLTLERVSIVDSSQTGQGAIVFNAGALTLRDSLIGWNQLTATDDDSGLIDNRGLLDMRGSRIIGNSVSRVSEHVYAAAAVRNSGRLRADRTDFEANRLIDPFGGLTFHAVLNYGEGTAQGLLPSTLIAEVLDPR